MSRPGAGSLALAGPRPCPRALGVAGGVALVANGEWELAQRPLYATALTGKDGRT